MIIKKFEELGYKLGALPECEVLHGQMPNEEYYFIVLRTLNFMPKLKGN
jgi:hypothetical protein